MSCVQVDFFHLIQARNGLKKTLLLLRSAFSYMRKAFQHSHEKLNKQHACVCLLWEVRNSSTVKFIILLTLPVFHLNFFYRQSIKN
jgi:hypothetical protein